MNSSLAGREKKKKKNRFRFDERMWAGLIFCSSGIFALFDRILEVRFFFLLLLFDVVYAVNWKGRLRYIYIYTYNKYMERTKSSVHKNNIFYE